MEKTYQPQSIETRWYETWENNGYFAAPDKAAPGQSAYSIMIPPPNVTGSLHMGHAFQDTLMDLLTRYHRMAGDATLWQPGTDHAGIATQMVVERQLGAEEPPRTRHDLGRDKFIDRIWDWKEESGGNITQQLRRMGASVDWERERFTMDEGLNESVRETFVKLHKEGLIYRGKRLVNWDPKLKTAVSDLEVISEEENGFLWHFKYPLADGSGHVVVATTRPETMLGDSAVAVHPDDERFQHLIGKTVMLPLANREIPIVGDDYVDMEFGTGCLKITPAHDFNDYEVGKRNDLAIINIFTDEAAINDDMPEKYRGMDRADARKAVVADLDALGLLDSVKEHKLMQPRGDRSGVVIEPYLTDQWYVKAAPLAEPAIKAVEDGRIRFVPDNWSKTYFEWLRNIEDWCISRQIWWGHRIPAWYDDEGNVYVGRTEEEVRAENNLGDRSLRQDDDVLDTWFSSALWPFSTLGWPDNTDALKTYYPTSVLVTGFDIIFFWVARMIMMGMKFMDGEVPFKEIYIHGLVRDADGQKMSKSKGNVLDPIDVIDGIELEALVTKRTSSMQVPQLKKKIEKQTRKQFPDGIPAYGTDALRFNFAAQATQGRDIRFDLARLEGYRNFCNKLWNASRYAMMNAEGEDCGANGGEIQLSLADRWILSRLNATSGEVRRHIEQYRFDLAAKLIYDFVWGDYCDWYLELCKPVLNSDKASDAEKRGTRQTLVGVLESILRLAHPFMPFITEEIWQRVAPMAGVKGDSVSLQPFPDSDNDLIEEMVEEDMAWVQEFILGLRRIRAEMDISPGKPLPILLENSSADDREKVGRYRRFLDSLGRIESLKSLKGDEQAPESAVALLGNLRICVPMAGLIDKDAELARLDRNIAKLEKGVMILDKKLSNEGFTAKAPAAVVEKERKNLADQQQQLDDLQVQRVKIAAL